MRRVLVMLALAGLLSGCFGSDRPMFPATSAVRALGEGGRYATFEVTDGKEKSSDPLVVRPRDDGGYDFVNEKGASNPVTFHPIAGGLHVAQVKLEGDQGYGYVVTRIVANGMTVIPAECDRQDGKTIDALGVVRRNQYECRIDNVADPAAFFAGLTFSPPVSRMVRE
jgi:hypothetical protein